MTLTVRSKRCWASIKIGSSWRMSTDVEQALNTAERAIAAKALVLLVEAESLWPWNLVSKVCLNDTHAGNLGDCLQVLASQLSPRKTQPTLSRMSLD